MKILIIIVLTVTIVQLPSIECEHPQYSFRCLENGEIRLFGLHLNSIIKRLQGNVGNCNETSVKSSPNKSNYYYVIPKECADSTTKQGDRSVQIVVYDPIIDRKKRQSQTTTTTPTTKPPSPTTKPPSPTTKPSTTTVKPTSTATTTQFIGGHGNHSFNITCKSIPTEGVNETVVHVFKGNEFKGLPENNMEVDGVEMRFKAVNDINAPDINTIFVGDEFFMFLEYKGKQDYSLVPKKCTAYSGTSLGTTNQKDVELWNWNTGTDCTLNRELLQGFKNESSRIIYAEMFGFRFSDSDYITIRCEVGIFPSNTNKKLCNYGGRKRRRIENVEVKTKFAASEIRVFDNKDMYQMENKSPQKSFDISVWIVLVTGTLLNGW